MFGAIALAACSESENFTQPNLSTDKIAFHAATLNDWGTTSETVSQSATSRVVDAANQNGPLAVQSSLGCPLYLHPVEQVGIHIWNKDNQPVTRSGVLLADTEKETTVATRGAKQTSLSGYSSFGVSAIYKKTSDTGDGSVFFANQPAAPYTTGSQTLTWHIPDNTNYYWPTDGSLSFYAYAPHTDDANMVSVGTDIDGVKTIHYKASDTDITGQPDLIVASTTESRQSTDASKGVNLPFAHALTAVSFAVSSDLKDAIGTGTIDKVEVVGVHDEGDCTLTATTSAPSTTFAWSNQQGTQTYSFTLTGVTIGTDLALTSGDNTLMMIPQTLPDGAMVKFTFTVNGAQQVLSAPINGQTWVPGASVIYKLSAKAVNSLGASDFAYPTAEAWQTASYPVSAFDANEQIGLYVVDENNNVVEENIPVTKQADGSWTTAKSFLKLAKYKYFAYYPYSATTPTVTPSATTAEDFFKDKIDNWPLAADQSADLATLKAQDLQVAKGVVAADASTLTFPMAHKMGLAVLTLGSKQIPTTRTFTTDDYKKYYNADGTLGSLTGVPISAYIDSDDKTKVTAADNFEGTSNRPYKHTASSTTSGSTSSTTKYFSIVKPSTATTFQSKAGIDNAWHTNAVTFNVSPGSAETKAAESDSLFIFLARRYNCAGKVEEFTAPKTGNYKLECWGAQGSISSVSGAVAGRGGYSVGYYKASSNNKLFVCVGNYGTYGVYSYNNTPPSNASFYSGLPGGGATHVSKSSGGELKEFETHKSDVLIVAGGGGSVDIDAGITGNGGYGGGSVGGNGSKSYTWTVGVATGGTSNAGGITSSYPDGFVGENGRFGLGGYGYVVYNGVTNYGAQGGSGWYGGGGAALAGSSGGGSGYIGGVQNGKTIAGNAVMPSPNGGTETGHTGNGACNITWIL